MDPIKACVKERNRRAPYGFATDYVTDDGREEIIYTLANLSKEWLSENANADSSTTLIARIVIAAAIALAFASLVLAAN